MNKKELFLEPLRKINKLNELFISENLSLQSWEFVLSEPEGLSNLVMEVRNDDVYSRETFMPVLKKKNWYIGLTEAGFALCEFKNKKFEIINEINETELLLNVKNINTKC